MWGRSQLAATAAALLLIVSSAGASLVTDVVVRFDPPIQTVNINDVCTVDLIADNTAPVVGWGLDVGLSVPSIASIFTAPAVAFPPWVAAAAVDGDDLAALADPLAPTNGSVSGTGILLATLTFQADAQGTTDLLAGTTPGDLTEGFPLDPTGFATLSFEPGQVTVIPEPGTLGSLLCAGLMLMRSRRRNRHPNLQSRGW